MPRKNELHVFDREQAQVLVKGFRRYAANSSHTRITEIDDWRKSQRNVAAILLRRDPPTNPNEERVLGPLYVNLRNSKILTGDRNFAKIIETIRCWNFQEISGKFRRHYGHDFLEMSSTNSSALRPNKRSSTHLFDYFHEAMGFDRITYAPIRTDLTGAFFGYRLKRNGKVLRSVFLIPKPNERAYGRPWVDAVVPSFLHWLLDNRGVGRFVRGHIIPLAENLVFIGFVGKSEDISKFGGVKILAFNPTDNAKGYDARKRRYDRIDGVFLSKQANKEYEAGRIVLVRATDRVTDAIIKASRRFAMDFKRNLDLAGLGLAAKDDIDKMIQKNMKQFVLEISVEAAQNETRAAGVANLLKDLSISGGVLGDKTGHALMHLGTVNLGR